MQELVRAVREVRSRYTIDPKLAVEVSVRCGAAVTEDFGTLAPFIRMLAGVSRLECGPEVARPRQAAAHVSPEFTVFVSLSGLIDVAAERKRLDKQREEKVRHLQAARGKLSNSNFVDKAPAEVVQQQRDLVADLQAQIQAIEDNLRDLQEG
jgi:valyl-tRNA synthetase